MLDRCLASLRSVTTECEIIVVDDGNTTEIPYVVAQHQRSDPRIRYFRNETNAGIPENFNVGLRLATGDYLCVIGDDDIALPASFDAQVKLLDHFPMVGLVYGKWNAVDEFGSFIRTETLLHARHSYVGNTREFFELLPGNYINLLVAVFRRDLWEQYGGFDPAMTVYADWDMFLRYSLNTQTAFVHRVLGEVSHHDETDTSRRMSTVGPVAKIQVWRKHLLESDGPIVIGERLWSRMRQHFRVDLETFYRDQPELVAEWLDRADRLLDEYRAETQRRWAIPSRSPDSKAGPMLSILVRDWETAANAWSDLASSGLCCEIILPGKPPARPEQSPGQARWIETGRLRGAAAWNSCLKQARGQLLCVVHASSCLSASMLSRKLEILQNDPNVDVVFSAWTTRDDSDAIQRKDAGVALASYVDGRADLTYLLSSDDVPLDTVVFRRRVLERLGGFDTQLDDRVVDWDVVVRYLLGSRCAYLDDPGVELHQTKPSGARSVELEAKCMFAVWKKWLARQPLIIGERLWSDIELAALARAQESPPMLDYMVNLAEMLALLRSAHHRPLDERVDRVLDPQSSARRKGTRDSVNVPADWIVGPLLRIAAGYSQAGFDEYGYQLARRVYEYEPTVIESAYNLAILAARTSRGAEVGQLGRQLLAHGLPSLFETRIRNLMVSVGQELGDGQLILDGLSRHIEGMDELSATVTRADAFRLLGDLDAQCQTLLEGVREYPHEARLRVALAEALEARGMEDQAVTVLRSGLWDEQNAPLFAVKLANLLTKRGQVDEALDVMRALEAGERLPDS